MPNHPPEELALPRLDAVFISLVEQAEKAREMACEALGVDLDDPIFHRQQLLDAIGQAITTERVKLALDEEGIAKGQVADLVNSVAEVIHQHFDPLGLQEAPRRRGRPVENQERDRKILMLHRQGLSLGQIARKLRSQGELRSSNRESDAQTVRSALTRAEKREQVEHEAAKMLEEGRRHIQEGLDMLSEEQKAK